VIIVTGNGTWNHKPQNGNGIEIWAENERQRKATGIWTGK